MSTKIPLIKATSVAYTKEQMKRGEKEREREGSLCLPHTNLATHSSILAWKIPWMEGPGRLKSMKLRKVGHD